MKPEEVKQPKQPKRGHYLPHGAGSFYYSPAGDRWIGAVEAGWNADGGRRRISVTAKNEDEAWRKLRALQKRILDEGVPPPTASVKPTVKTWCENQLKVRRQLVKPKTYASERSAINKWVLPILGAMKLADLRPQHLRALADKVVEGDGKPRTQTHGRYVQRTLRTYLRAAADEGHEVHAGVFKMKLMPVSANPRQALSLEESVAVLQEAHKHDDHSRWDAALLQGLRQGEAMGLTWDRVDFENGLLYIDRSLQEVAKGELGTYAIPEQFRAAQVWGRFWLMPPKTEESVRVVPMIPEFQRSLEEWRKVAPKSKLGLVWPRPDGKPRLPEYDRAEFRQLQTRAGVTKNATGTLYTVHEARHATVSILLELGTAREVIEAIVGQTELVEGYVHVRDSRTRAALADLGEALKLGA